MTKTMNLIKDATLIGVVHGHRCYEHPIYGDEDHLIVIDPNGLDVSDNFCAFDLSTVEEILEG